MLRRALRLFAIAVLLTAAVMVAAVAGVYGVAPWWIGRMPQSPFAARNLCFADDLPGATSRYRTFFPVRCDDAERRPLAPAEGADHATLRFEDRDGDGVPEAVIESSAFRCWTSLPCYDAWRVVMRIDPATGGWTALERTGLPELSAAAAP